MSPIPSCSTKIQIITFLKPLVAPVSLSLDLTIVTSLNLGLKSMFFLGIPHLIRVTNVFLLLANYLSLRMLFLMKSNFLIQICFFLPLSLIHILITPSLLFPPSLLFLNLFLLFPPLAILLLVLLLLILQLIKIPSLLLSMLSLVLLLHLRFLVLLLMLDPLLSKTILLSHQICLPLKYLTVQHWRLFLQLILILCRPDQSLEFIYQDLIQPCYLLTVNPNL